MGMIRRSSIGFLFFLPFFPFLFLIFLKIFFRHYFFFSLILVGGRWGARWWEGRQGFNGSFFSNESFRFEP